MVVDRLRRRILGEDKCAEKRSSSVPPGGKEAQFTNSQDAATREACLERRITEQQIAIERLSDRVRCSDVYMEEQTATINGLQDRVNFLEGKVGIQFKTATRYAKSGIVTHSHRTPIMTPRDNDTTDGDYKINSRFNDGGVKSTDLEVVPPNSGGVVNGVVQVLAKPVRVATLPMRYAGQAAGYTAMVPYRLAGVLFGMLGKADDMLDELNGSTVPKMNDAADAVSDMVGKAEAIPDKVEGLLNRVEDGPLKQVEGMLSFADENTLKKVDSLVDLLRLLVLGSLILVMTLSLRAVCQAIRGI